VHDFASGAPQSDDIAIFTIKVARRVSRMKLRLHATPEEVMRAVEALENLFANAVWGSGTVRFGSGS
jgi:hypothetical protein